MTRCCAQLPTKGSANEAEVTPPMPPSPAGSSRSFLPDFQRGSIYLQVGKHEEYTALAAQKHSIRQPIPANRGMILDRNGEILAASIPVRKVILDGTHVKKPADLAQLAAPYLGLPEDALEKTLKEEVEKKSQFKVVLPELAEEVPRSAEGDGGEISARPLFLPEQRPELSQWADAQPCAGLSRAQRPEGRTRRRRGRHRARPGGTVPGGRGRLPPY